MITKKGVIIKRSGDKTVKVEINEYRSHAKYKKRYRVTNRLLAHDEKNTAKVGDKVVIMQCRPKSKRKHWILTDAA